MDADGPHIYKDKHAQINEFVYTKHECNKNTYSTGWRRLVGSLKLQIIFHQRATKYRAHLLKMPYEDKGSYESSPPCTRGMECFVGEKGLEKNNKNGKTTFAIKLPSWMEMVHIFTKTNMPR